MHSLTVAWLAHYIKCGKYHAADALAAAHPEAVDAL